MSAPVTQEQLEETVKNLNLNIAGTANNLNANLVGTANNLQANQNGLQEQILNSISKPKYSFNEVQMEKDIDELCLPAVAPGGDPLKEFKSTHLAMYCYRGGKEFMKGYGTQYRNQKGDPIDPEKSIFRIQSMTKFVGGLSGLKAIELGLVPKPSTIVPEFENTKWYVPVTGGPTEEEITDYNLNDLNVGEEKTYPKLNETVGNVVWGDKTIAPGEEIGAIRLGKAEYPANSGFFVLYKLEPCLIKINYAHLWSESAGLTMPYFWDDYAPFGLDKTHWAVISYFQYQHNKKYGFKGKKQLYNLNVKNFIDEDGVKHPFTANEVDQIDVHKEIGVLVNQPGTNMTYASNNYIWSGILELRYEEKYGEFKRVDKIIQEWFFDPLEMHDTFWTLQPGDEREDRIVSYDNILEDGTFADSDTGITRVFQPRNNANFNPNGSPQWFEYTGSTETYSANKPIILLGTGLHTTITDYAKLCKLILNGGRNIKGERVLSRDSIEAIKFFSPADTTDSGAKAFFGTTEVYGEAERYSAAIFTYGLASGYPGISPVSRPYNNNPINSFWNKPRVLKWGGWGQTTFLIYPEEDSIVIFFNNTISSPNYGVALSRDTFSSQFEKSWTIN